MREFAADRGVTAVRILIFGAGVIGSLYAALLAEAGYDVSVYARGQRPGSARCSRCKSEYQKIMRGMNRT